MSLFMTVYAFVRAFLLFRRKKEWDEIFLNSNYLAGIRQAGINGRNAGASPSKLAAGRCDGGCDGGDGGERGPTIRRRRTQEAGEQRISDVMLFLHLLLCSFFDSLSPESSPHAKSVTFRLSNPV